MTVRKQFESLPCTRLRYVTYMFLCPRLHWALDPFFGVNPPILSHVRQVAEAEVVQVYEEPLSLLFSIVRLIRLKTLYIKFRCINDLAMRLFLKEVKCKL